MRHGRRWHATLFYSAVVVQPTGAARSGFFASAEARSPSPRPRMFVAVDAASERILCVKVASRGDLLLAAPAFPRSREERPRAHITLLVGTSCRDVADPLPSFDNVHEMDDRAFFGDGLLRRAREAARVLGWIRASGFSEGVVLHRDWRYAALLRVAGVPVRRGFATPRAARFLTHPYAAGEGEHHADQYLGVVGGAGRRPAPAASVLTGLWRFRAGERERALEAAAVLGFAPRAAQWVGLGFGGGQNVKTRTTLK